VVDVIALLAGVAGEDALSLRAKDEEDLLAGEDLLLEAELAEAPLDPDLVEVGLELEDTVEILRREESEGDRKLAEIRTFSFGHVFGRVYRMSRTALCVNGSAPQDEDARGGRGTSEKEGEAF
jgi:hypothetical protein